MTTLHAPTSADINSDAALKPKNWGAPIFLGVIAILAILLLIVFGRSGISTFSFTSGRIDVVSLPGLPIPVRGYGIFAAIVAALMAIGSVFLVRARRKIPIWYIAIYSLVLLIGFLTWATAGHTLPFTGLLSGALALSVPLIFGAMGGVISERSGVVNVAIEGQLLSGAFVSAVAATMTHSVVVGLIAAMIAGVLVAFVLAAFAIKYFVNQIIVGIVLNGLVLGLTSFLYQTSLANDASKLNLPPTLPTITVPGLSAIPVIGPVLFNQTIIVYIMYVAVAVVFYGLFFTRWGLRLRSVGEHPQAADTVGINVNSTRFWNVSIAGALVGFGGAYFTLGTVGAFTENVTSGAGYIALAAVIFGGWNPIRATFAALLFGFANELQSVLGIIGSPVPSNLLLMLPYIVTIIAVAGLVGQSRGPAASGKPYFKS